MIDRRSINLDITTKCTLACPECRRTIFNKKGIKINGGHMSFSDFKKVHSFFDHFSFCGGVSDPIYHPQFIRFLEYSKDKEVDVHTAASHKNKEWYVDAFKSNPNAKWIFGLDGLPKESHKYRVNQDGEKIYDIMKMGVDMKMDIVWQYLVFDYNKEHIEEARGLSNGMIFSVLQPRDFRSGPA